VAEIPPCGKKARVFLPFPEGDNKKFNYVEEI
jgi:hypothetical protein